MRTTTTITLAVLLLFAPAFAEDDAGDKKYTPKELEEVVGPVALYPDQVLTSVLPATAVPLDVVKAARWLAQQKGEVDGAPEDSGWDGAVEALVQFPDVLQWMNENPDWMEQMGYAMSIQQEDVLAAIQEFRKKSKDAGNLESNDKQQVVVEQETQVIQIQPTQPEMIYVPQYNPVYVTQPASSYPPSYPGTFFAGFAAGAVGAWAVHEIRWGGHSGHGHYGGGGLYVNHSPTFNFNKGGQINRVSGARVNSGTAWRSHKTAAQLPARAPRARGGAVARPRTPTWNQRRSPARPATGGMRAPQRRPTQGARPRPAPGGGRRPTPAPGVRPGAGGRPSFGAGGGNRRPGAGAAGGNRRPGAGAAGGNRRPGGGAAGGQRRPQPRSSGGRQASQRRPDRKPSASRGRSGLGGSRSGASAHRNSQRGRSSMGSSRSRSSGGRASRGGGRSRGGGGRGRR